MAETVVDRFYEEFRDLISFLEEKGEISHRNVVETNFRKVLLIVAASYFEAVICRSVLQVVGDSSNNNDLIVEFVRNKAISRQYHTLFKWEANNANHFFGLFGEAFKLFMAGIITRDGDLETAVKAFLELGRERNRLVHQDFGTFPLEKTSAEIYELYKCAQRFVDLIPVKLREFGTADASNEK